MEHTSFAKKYVQAYRLLVETETDLLSQIGAQAERLLQHGEVVGEHLSPMIEQFMATSKLEKIPDSMKATIEDRTRTLVYYGLFTHCLLFDAPSRLNTERIDQKALYAEWVMKSLTANSALDPYDKDNAHHPTTIFRAFYRRELEPLQKELKLEWRQRLRNENEFKNYFASGVVLGMMCDMKTV